MSQVYLQLHDVAVLHRTHEPTQPRWRQDDFYKLMIASKGSMTFETLNSRLHLHSGQFLLLNPEEKHQQIACSGDKFLFEFSLDLVNEVTREILGEKAEDFCFDSIPFFQPDLFRFVSSLLPELHEPQPGQRLLLEHAAMQVLVLAMRSIGLTSSNRSRQLDITGDQKAILMMMDNYREPVSLEDLARHTDMSKFALIRQFRESVGIPPYEWLQQYRIERVSEALLRTQHTILEIAMNNGFSSVSAMNRQFQRLHGTSPSQWRKLHQ